MTDPWWMVDEYLYNYGIPSQFDNDFSGPRGVALVRAYPNGKTDPGWGSATFMDLYLKNREFRAVPILFGYNKGKHAFAFIMRSMALVCIDIDGKNGGLEYAKHLGPLPPTLSETSKSGNGYHLFYKVGDMWDDKLGYARVADHIGIVQGVDIRGTGCVYHYDTQRWNNRPIAELPLYMLELLENKQQKQLARATRITSIINSNDDLEILMLKEELMSDLAKDIPDGRRNNTLFAIGQKMKAAGIADWSDKIGDRADQLGLDSIETAKLISNIDTYV